MVVLEKFQMGKMIMVTEEFHPIIAHSASYYCLY